MTPEQILKKTVEASQDFRFQDHKLEMLFFKGLILISQVFSGYNRLFLNVKVIPNIDGVGFHPQH